MQKYKNRTDCESVLRYLFLNYTVRYRFGYQGASLQPSSFPIPRYGGLNSLFLPVAGLEVEVALYRSDIARPVALSHDFIFIGIEGSCFPQQAGNSLANKCC